MSRDSISCVRHSNADLAIGRKGRSSYEERVRHSVCHWGKNCPPLLPPRFLFIPTHTLKTHSALGARLVPLRGTTPTYVHKCKHVTAF